MHIEYQTVFRLVWFNNMHPSLINEMYVQNYNIYDYNTRQKFQLHVSKGQTDLYAKGFYCSSILKGNAAYILKKIYYAWKQFIIRIQ